MNNPLDSLREIARCGLDSESNYNLLQDQATKLNDALLEIYKNKYNEFNILYYQALDILNENEILFIELMLKNLIKLASNFNKVNNFRDCSIYNDKEQGSFLIYLEKFLEFLNGKVRFFLKSCDGIPPVSKEIYTEAMNLLAHIFDRGKINHSRGDYVGIVSALAISRLGAKQFGCLDEVYGHFFSFIQIIDQQGDPQLARDCLEELIEASEYDGVYYCGMICKLVLCVKQKRLFEGMLQAQFVLFSIEELKEIHSYFQLTLILNIGQLLRDLQAFEFAKLFYEMIIDIDGLNSYDSQRVKHSYFSLRLLLNDKRLVEDVQKYLAQNLKDICSEGRNGLIPWIVLLHNMMKVYEGSLDIFINPLNEMKQHLQEPDIDYINLQLGIECDLKESLCHHLNSIYKSYRDHDISAQLISVNPIVQKSLLMGLKENDCSLLLVALLSQFVPTSINSIANEKLRVIDDKYFSPTQNFVETFFTRFFNCIKENNQTVVVIGRFNDEVFSVVCKGEVCCLVRNNGRYDEIKYWTENILPSIGFSTSRRRHGQIEIFEMYWEEESNFIKSQLPSLKLDSIDFIDALLILPTVDLLKYPANFLQSKDLFISSTVPVSTIFPSYFFKDNNMRDFKKIYIELITPEQPDMTVGLGIENIKKHANCYFQNKLYKNNQNEKVSFFIGHGIRDVNRFVGVALNDDEVCLPRDFTNVCSGKIVVLFVCHAGFSTGKFFSIDSYSIAKNLIENGVNHVIAPAWPLSIDLIGYWAKEFLDNLVSGRSVSDSCFYANHVLKNVFKIESAWCCLHHFQG